MKFHFLVGLRDPHLGPVSLAWGFVGSTTARFSHFVKGPVAWIGYLKDLLLLGGARSRSP